MKKKFLSLLVLCCVVINISPIEALAAQPINIEVDGQLLSLDVPPTIIDGRTMVPMRGIFEALGASVGWDGSTRTVTGTKGSTKIKLPLDKPYAFRNGERLSLDVPATSIRGRTMVPTRFIAEMLGAQVGWNGKTRTVEIVSGIGSDLAVGDSLDLTVEEIAEKSNAVVCIEVPDGTGSGFFISSDGILVTNYHVIYGAADAAVYLEDERVFYNPVVLGYSEEMDIAILKVHGNDLPYCELGNADNVRQGQSIVAIGSPQGLFNTVSTGIVSQIYDDCIQISAPISPGSSGGALFNMQGEVIGITCAGIIEGENLGFAIPIKALEVVPQDSSLTLAELAYGESEHGSALAPTGFIATAVSDSEIHLYWDRVDNAHYYHVYRSSSYDGPYEAYNDEDGNKSKVQWHPDFCVRSYNLEPDTTMYFKVTAVKDGVESDFSEIAYATTFENEVPIPTGFTATAVSDSAIHLYWDEVKDADFYYVYRSYSRSGPYEAYLDDEGDKREFDWDSDYCVNIYNCKSNATMYFKVTAVVDGVESDFSEIAYATPHDTGLPIPIGFTATAVSDDEIRLYWNQIATADCYYVYRSYSYDGPYEAYTNDDGDKKAFSWGKDFCVNVHSIDPETTLYFKVTAVIDGVESDFSQIVHGTTFGSKEVPIPTGFSAIAISNSEIRLYWDQVENADYYHVYRSYSYDGLYKAYRDDYGNKYQSTWDPDDGVNIYDIDPGSTLYFKVTAVVEGIESDFSEIASATTFK